MSTIIEPPDATTEPRGKLLRFPADDFAAPESITWREWAKLEIATVRARRREEAPTGQPEPEDAPEGLETPAIGIQRDGSDWAGNPREYHCSRSHLENVLAARDEALAREARRTARPSGK